MARMPHSTWLGEHGGTAMARYDIVCVHTIVGYAPAHAAHFSTRADGWIGQSRDTSVRSAANLNGNHRVIAIENEDHGGAYGGWNTSDGRAVPGFTTAQREAIAHILVFCYRAHGIPLVPCPDSRPGSRGIAYHRQGCDGNFAGYAYPGRVSGGELWSSAGGKVCPGDRRIYELLNIIIPRARIIAGLDAPPPPEDDMLRDETIERWDEPTRQMVNQTAAEILGGGYNYAQGAALASVRIEAKLDAQEGTLTNNQALVMAAIADNGVEVDLTTEQMQALLTGMTAASKLALRELLGSLDE